MRRSRKSGTGRGRHRQHRGQGLRKLFSPPMLDIKRGRAITLRSPHQRSWTDGQKVHAPLGRRRLYARAVDESRI